MIGRDLFIVRGRIRGSRTEESMGTTSTGGALLLAVGFAFAAGEAAQDSSRPVRVVVRGAALHALPAVSGDPVLALLQAGTAVRTGEARDGFVRVTVEGWVAESELRELSLQPPRDGGPPRSAEPLRAGEPGMADQPQVAPEPVFDLALAHHVGVEATRRDGADGVRLAVELTLRTIDGRAVLPRGSRVEGRMLVFEQRRVVGGRTRGAERGARAIVFEDGRASVEIPLADLGAAPLEVALVSARAVLSPQRTLWGAATDVEVGKARADD
jgi:hypothetical protein